MPVRMAVDIDRHGEAGYVAGLHFNMYSEACCATPEPGRTDAQPVYLFEDRSLHLSQLRIGTGFADMPE